MFFSGLSGNSFPGCYLMLDLTVSIILSVYDILSFIGLDYIVGVSVLICALAFLHRITKKARFYNFTVFHVEQREISALFCFT